MNIEFLENFKISPEGPWINFWAEVDGNRIHCKVFIDALQDHNSSNAHLAPELLFEQDDAYFKNIARNKIMAPGFNGKNVSITIFDI